MELSRPLAAILLLLFTPVLLDADDIGRSEPAIFASPSLRRVFAAILLWDRPLAQERLVVFLPSGAHE
jgi:hypothetical protein